VMLRALAPAKLNLCLFVGPTRTDGRHQLVTVFESLTLADELELTTLEAGASADAVVCPEVHGENLVETALRSLRSAGWRGPKVRIVIRKRIPVAAGLGGGSADAAAALRLAHAVESLADGVAARVARELGADVPSQLAPGLTLGTGAGELLEPLGPLRPHAIVLVPQPLELSTAEVYRQADRLGLSRSGGELAALRDRLRAALDAERRLPDELLDNDLAPAAISLAPVVAETLAALRRAGADQALVCGSGPTVAGILWGDGASGRADQMVRELGLDGVTAVCATPVGPEFGEPRRA
jgi:4-diphosphocytidyl-2-C-methyl-D-erythritol kinase